MRFEIKIKQQNWEFPCLAYKKLWFDVYLWKLRHIYNKLTIINIFNGTVLLWVISSFVYTHLRRIRNVNCSFTSNFRGKLVNYLPNKLGKILLLQYLVTWKCKILFTLHKYRKKLQFHNLLIKHISVYAHNYHVYVNTNNKQKCF